MANKFQGKQDEVLWPLCPLSVVFLSSFCRLSRSQGPTNRKDIDVNKYNSMCIICLWCCGWPLSDQRSLQGQRTRNEGRGRKIKQGLHTPLQSNVVSWSLNGSNDYNDTTTTVQGSFSWQMATIAFSGLFLPSNKANMSFAITFYSRLFLRQ